MLQSAKAERIVALENTSPLLASASKGRPKLVVSNPPATHPRTSQEQRQADTTKLPGRKRLFMILGLTAALWLLAGTMALLYAALL